MTLLAWAPKGREVVGAVQVTPTQVMNKDNYLTLLANRLQELATEAPEDLDQVSELLVEAGLIAIPLDPEDEMKLGYQILFREDEGMQERLDELGIPGRMPSRVETNNPAAQKAVEEATLLSWAMKITSGMIHRE